MSFTIPKNDSKYRWTQHSIRKMMYYGLSADRVKRVIRAPKRMEEGIAPETLAAMQPGPNKNKPSEIWVMYANKSKIKNQKLKMDMPRKKTDYSNLLPAQKIIITAWRYPGVSPVRSKIPIPADIVAELRAELGIE